MGKDKIDFRETIKKRMIELKIENAQQLAVGVNNYWLALQIKKLKGNLPENTQRITRQAISNYLSGRSEMTAANIELIFEFLGIKIDISRE